MMNEPLLGQRNKGGTWDWNYNRRNHDERWTRLIVCFPLSRFEINYSGLSMLTPGETKQGKKKEKQ